MKILIIGTKYAPIPCVEGGAIESLIDDYLIYNSKNKKLDITVYSSAPKGKRIENNKQYNNVEFRYIHRKKLKYRVIKIFNIIKRIISKIILNNNIEDEYIHAITKDLTKKNELSSYNKVIILNNISNVLYICKKNKAKHILYLHNDYLNKNTKNGKKIVDSLDEIWCVSDFIQKRVQEIKQNKKTKVIYNGVDLEKFNKKVEESVIKKIKSEYNVSDKDFTILYTGRILEEKGVRELINAFKSFLKVNKQAKLLIVGAPIKKSRKFYNEILKDNCNGKISFLGYQTHDNINALYKIADVQVVPSKCNEAFGLTVIEGMSAGILMIVSNSGGIPEIVDNKCAWIVRIDNLEKDIENALYEAYKLPENKKKEMIQAAQKKCDLFDIKKYNEKFTEYLR